MPSTMRALVARSGSVVLEERPIPSAGDTEVVVRTTAASLCGADTSGVTGSFGVADGTIIGHESVGVVAEVGRAVQGFSVGDRVAVGSATACGQCRNCQRNDHGHCRGKLWGAYSAGVERDGSMAEFFTVPDAGRNLARIPNDVPDDLAVCVTDTLASGTTGPEAAAVPLGGTVAVFGQGHIGLGAAAGARLIGASRVIAVKASPGSEDVSRAMGADICLNLAEHDVIAEIHALTDGEGVDCAIEASGVIASFPRVLEATRFGGTAVVLSSYDADDAATLQIPLAHFGFGLGEKTILSTFSRTGNERLERLFALVQMRRVNLSPLITHHYRFDDAPQAFTDLVVRKPGLIKPLILF